MLSTPAVTLTVLKLDKRRNFEEAFAAAQALYIPRLLDVDDMVKGKLDEKAIKLYVACFASKVEQDEQNVEYLVDPAQSVHTLERLIDKVRGGVSALHTHLALYSWTSCFQSSQTSPGITMTNRRQPTKRIS